MNRVKLTLLIVCVASNGCGLLISDTYRTERYQAVHEVTLNGDRAKMNEMLESNPHLIRVPDYDKNTLLHLAVLRNQVGEAQDLLARRANVNAVNTVAMTPLHLAAKLNRIEISKLLLSHKPNLSMRDARGWTPLTWAIKTRHDEIVPLLREAEAQQ